MLKPKLFVNKKFRKLNQSGFAHLLYPILGLVVILVIAGAGFYVYQQNKSGAGGISKKQGYILLYSKSGNVKYKQAVIGVGTSTGSEKCFTKQLFKPINLHTNGKAVQVRCNTGNYIIAFLKNAGDRPENSGRPTPVTVVSQSCAQVHKNARIGYTGINNKGQCSSQ